MWLKDYIPALKYGAKLVSTDIIGGSLDTFSAGNVWYVDGDNGSASNGGNAPDNAFAAIQTAVTAAVVDGGVIYIKARDMAAGASDPVSYAETVIIPAGSSRMALIGVSGNRTQGGLPQIKKGSGSAALLIVRSPGCLVTNLGFNGGGSTGGGILLDDDGGTAKSAFGTTIGGCHFKNCIPSTATDSSTGGAIFAKNAWQCLVKGNIFYKNVGGVTVTSPYSDVQDFVIEDNTFSGTAATADTYIYVNSAGSGLVIRRNVFASVLPALSSGANQRYVLIDNATGIFAENYVSGSYTTSGFGAARAAANIPTTVGIVHNYSDAGLIVRQ